MAESLCKTQMQLLVKKETTFYFTLCVPEKRELTERDLGGLEK